MTIHKDDFDVALMPGKRAELADIYRVIRASEAEVIATMRAGQADLGHLFEDVAACPACARPADGAPAMYVKDGMHVVRCPGCGFVYSRQVFSQSYDQSRYADPANENMYIRLKGHPVYAALEDTKCAYVVQAIGAFAAPPGALLDVGSSTGTLLVQAQRAGWTAHGLEASAAQVAVARAKGLSAVQGYFPDALGTPAASALPPRFNVITALDVLEHMIDPLAFLARVRGALVPGGVLAVQVPNIDSLFIRLEGAANSNICAGHWLYFSPASLKALLARAGFTCLHLETYITELDRAAAHAPAAIAAAFNAVTGRPRTAVGPPSATEVHNALMGYKVFGLFRSSP
ncbi:MAG: class I SAM-dependent methyltransferase [Rhodospirillaceae bacterium]|nr:class I SAM-dependent methyltransferase [Rhodospirillaceae bacterium]